MKNTISTLAVAVAVGAAALTTPILAQEADTLQVAYQKDDGAAERIDLSGKLRMLSQRIPSAACHLAADVDMADAQKLLASATTEFDAILKALEFGNADLNINGAEERRKTIAKIHAMQQTWAPVKAAADAMIAGDAFDGQLEVILGQNMDVLESAKELVAEISGQYSNPTEIVHADAYLIDIAGRQRMLTQKMAKESCMLSTNTGAADTAVALEGTMQMFGATLEALRHGMPAVGIKRPPTAGISAGLEEVLKKWTAVKPSLDAILAGIALDTQAQAKKFQRLNKTMAKMNEVVGMYSKATKKEL